MHSLSHPLVARLLSLWLLTWSVWIFFLSVYLVCFLGGWSSWRAHSYIYIFFWLSVFGIYRRPILSIRASCDYLLLMLRFWIFRSICWYFFFALHTYRSHIMCVCVECRFCISVRQYKHLAIGRVCVQSIHMLSEEMEMGLWLLPFLPLSVIAGKSKYSRFSLTLFARQGVCRGRKCEWMSRVW